MGDIGGRQRSRLRGEELVRLHTQPRGGMCISEWLSLLVIVCKPPHHSGRSEWTLRVPTRHGRCGVVSAARSVERSWDGPARCHCRKSRRRAGPTCGRTPGRRRRCRWRSRRLQRSTETPHSDAGRSSIACQGPFGTKAARTVLSCGTQQSRRGRLRPKIRMRDCMAWLPLTPCHHPPH
jgi:hypothetical protein